MDLFGVLGGAAWSSVFFIIALSIIVAVHEYGHYIVGRWSGIHAEVFSVGFGPVLLSRVDRRGTRWQIALIPFGGYVKFMGDADAASSRAELPEGLSPAERRHTLSGAPLWARAATVAAGPMANFILTFVVVLGMIFTFGMPEERPRIGALATLPEAQPLRAGDVITALGGMATPDLPALSKAIAALPRTPQVEFTVTRGTDNLSFFAPHPMLPLVASVQVKSAALDAGLKAGDVLLSANERTLVTFSDLQDVAFGSNGAPVSLKVWREGREFDLTLLPRPRDMPMPDGTFERRWMLGIASGMSFEMATRSAGLGEGLMLALGQMGNMISTTFSGITHMISGAISTCNMSGVIGMAETMGDAARMGAGSFVSMLAVLSMGVGILNLLPVPVLDGGHLVFYAYEALARRPPGARALRLLMSVGLTLLLALMAFALWNDITCV